MARIVVRSLGGMQQQVIAVPHSLIADEPEDYWGDGLGPNPYELLLGALGTCTAMTLLMYAQRKEWDLREVRVELDNDRVFGEDCLRCEEPNQYMDHIRQRVELKGSLDEEQLERLRVIAAKCPVHKTLGRGAWVSDHVDLVLD
jgi:putative redox protein